MTKNTTTRPETSTSYISLLEDDMQDPFGEILDLCVFNLCFIYAANTGMERRILWRDLEMAKIITKGNPWVMMGDFNVTLKLDEHQDLVLSAYGLDSTKDSYWTNMIDYQGEHSRLKVKMEALPVRSNLSRE
ncbi:RNA-directed DNA polymerase, eukaryota, reverse transcriptase zinc-binding domain protein, partial [Tanacetum coccineum]